jgi:hypothetical protein
MRHQKLCLMMTDIIFKYLQKQFEREPTMGAFESLDISQGFFCAEYLHGICTVKLLLKRNTKHSNSILPSKKKNLATLIKKYCAYN